MPLQGSGELELAYGSVLGHVSCTFPYLCCLVLELIRLQLEYASVYVDLKGCCCSCNVADVPCVTRVPGELPDQSIPIHPTLIRGSVTKESAFLSRINTPLLTQTPPYPGVLFYSTTTSNSYHDICIHRPNQLILSRYHHIRIDDLYEHLCTRHSNSTPLRRLQRQLDRAFCSPSNPLCVKQSTTSNAC